MILGLIIEAVEAGATEAAASAAIEISSRTLQRWRRRGVGDDNRAGPKTTPGNKLSASERREVISMLTSEEYRDLSPWQIVPKLADQDCYIASESTMYRILREEDMQHHRAPTAEPQKRNRPDELVATAPNQVWSWDITYLASPVRGAFYYAYMITDVFSRKIVGWTVEECEDGAVAARLLAASCKSEGAALNELSLHSDNGGPMKSATLLATLQSLGVAASFSRPSVSNDNPFSESLFRTVKCRPQYPRGPFASLEAARSWFLWFVNWYNTEHQHSGISFVTPDQRHRGIDEEILENRRAVYAAAKSRNPERWTGNTRDWSRVSQVKLNPTTTSDTARSEAA